MRWLAGVGLLLVAGAANAAAPPMVWRNLTPQEQKEVDALVARLEMHGEAGEFEEAARLAEQIAAYRERRQGPWHWQVIDARLVVQDWQRLTKVAKANRPQLVRGRRKILDGLRLLNESRPGEAEKSQGEALAIFQKALGELHPLTAYCYNSVAHCLEVQGRHAEALALHRKGLGITQKALGEQHPSTATNYANLANCLSGLDRHPEALDLDLKALAIRQKVLGEEHPSTATSYNAVAYCLNSQGRYSEALLLFQKALAIRQTSLGEEHLDTAQSYNNLASCLNSEGRHAEALPLYQKALTIRQNTLGEQHPSTATSYNNLAGCLDNQGRRAEALPLYRKALGIWQKALGELHPRTAAGYNNVAYCLEGQGRHAEALPLFQKALTIRQKALGEQRADTAQSYNNLAGCLNSQGRYGEALPLYQKALTIWEKALSEQHPSTAASYHNVAFCLNSQGRHAEALPLYQKALTVRQKVLGKLHPSTAESYNGVAQCMDGQGRHAEALPLHWQALGIWQKVLGEQHPLVAASYNNVAFCLEGQGRHAAALPLHRKALGIWQKTLGEQHSSTAASYNNLAGCMSDQGRHAEAALYWQAALLGFESGRLRAADTGFGRSRFLASVLSPRAALAATLVRLGQPLPAWRFAESDLGRGLLDDLLPASTDPTEAADLARLRRLDEMLLSLVTRTDLDARQKEQRWALSKERDNLQVQLAGRAARRARQRVLSLERVQKQIPADAAIVFWLDVLDQHLACVLRRDIAPAWVRLPGSGKNDAWTQGDDSHTLQGYLSLYGPFLPSDEQDKVLATAKAEERPLLREALDPAKRDGILQALHPQRLDPLEPHLAGVRRLIVVPTGQMTKVPVEALTTKYTVSYAPSASVYALRAEQHRPLNASSVLVLADPAFERAKEKLPDPPPHGLFVLSVVPGGLAAKIQLRPGDILVEYDGKALKQPDDLQETTGDGPVPVKLWRDGQTIPARIPQGKLGVSVDRKPLADALAAWRQEQRKLLALDRGTAYARLPGTRLEARSLQKLVPAAKLLLGSDASEQELSRLAATGELKKYRILHLATHGEANASVPELSALILAQDRLPASLTEQANEVLAGKKPSDGRLTVETVLKDWQLDADLVVLSACQTGLGVETSRDGMLGFTQALLQKGARSVLLSRWKVDDAATALLMTRFYQNILGQRDGLESPLGRADGLAEAKAWLRNLSRKDAETLLAKLVDGLPRGERGTVKKGLPLRKPDAAKDADDRPFAHPYYWAAFILIGDPQ